MEVKKELTHKEVASAGGKKRWAGKTAQERKEIMAKVWSKRKRNKGVDKPLASSTTVL